MDDLVTYALLATSFFFVALSFTLLVRYRQVSQRIAASTDLGRDLWSSLEQRLKKQDARILDVMGRLEVVQARVLAKAAAEAPASLSPLPVIASPPPPAEEKPGGVTLRAQPVQQVESQASHPLAGPVESKAGLDETQLRALEFLKERPKSTREIVDGLAKSREHTARLMKGLYERGLVARDASSKPFVYQLTEEGRKFLPGSA